LQGSRVDTQKTIARIDSKGKGKKKMENIVNVYFSSDCCGEDMTFAQTDYGICPCCGEHCEVIGEEVIEDNGEY
jgi:hypothetical protein